MSLTEDRAEMRRAMFGFWRAMGDTFMELSGRFYERANRYAEPRADWIVEAEDALGWVTVAGRTCATEAEAQQMYEDEGKYFDVPTRLRKIRTHAD